MPTKSERGICALTGRAFTYGERTLVISVRQHYNSQGYPDSFEPVSMEISGALAAACLSPAFLAYLQRAVTAWSGEAFTFAKGGAPADEAISDLASTGSSEALAALHLDYAIRLLSADKTQATEHLVAAKALLERSSAPEAKDALAAVALVMPPRVWVTQEVIQLRAAWNRLVAGLLMPVPREFLEKITAASTPPAAT